MELSEEDLGLINALQIAPRISWSDASGVLGVHATTLAARWERLRSAGAAWTTAHLIGDPKQMCLALVDIDCDMRLRADVTAALAAIPEVVTVEEAASNRDLILTVITPTLAEFTDAVVPQFKEIEGLQKYRTSLCTRLHTGGHAWRLNILDRSQQAALKAFAGPEAGVAGIPAVGELPQSHLDLIPFLAQDGRATAADMARVLGRSPATVQRQLNRLLASRVLSFRCEVAQKFSGYPVTCQWSANVPPGQHEAAAAELRGFRNLRLSASTTGRSNFVIVMWLHSLSDVMNAELALQQRIPGIELVESVVVLSSAKRVGWMLNPDTTASGAVVVPVAELNPTA
ncbi:Lrp/AsnC family transcriptional regulator [Arthrobacter cupressi]|uniref:DNA-binding transcriptional regulator, Lrp family n=1 Tax=Arthrobacter cupressi TaxID=1045773 RepID=A0A1G8JUI6_9MICC|nr:Lrp/AsnC ligand binding domain-containing protein [Arthrobacter cupressi]NYD77444.1 DNA-binding Lrp family transcriptional regulator [Arthrobacter cupressi]SDI34270.1 DNA-binding transcriptional regulator, Lrp family [Arthrobacter cupressi]